MEPYTALCTYLVRRDKIGELNELLGRHWPTLRRHELVTEDTPLIYFGEDYSGPFFVEIITWVDPGAPGKAYWIQEINDIWTDLYNFTEPRNGRPGIDYPTVIRQDHLVSSDPSSLSEAGTDAAVRWDWEQAYRNGRHLEGWDLDQASPELVDFLATQHQPPGRTALDLGCGSGSDCIGLARAGYQTSGIDLSSEALRIARQRASSAGVEVAWYDANVLNLPFADDSFDVITDRGCFHHIAENDRDRYACEVARVLKPGGRLFLRGSRTNRLPFVPITEESIARHFGRSIFEVGQLVPIDLVTKAGTLAGNLCVIDKRKEHIHDRNPEEDRSKERNEAIV